MGQIDTIKVDGTNYDVADKRLTECAVASDGKFFLAASDSNNPEISRMSHEDAAKVMSVQESLGGANDNVFILYYRKNDALLSMMEIAKWTAQQNSGEVATGVAVVAGERILVVAPTEASLNWSSANVAGGGKTTADRPTALGDFEGKANTAAQIARSEASGASYAPGYCAQYSRVNANGQGLTAGSWWLPSLGELMMIYANKDKINYALSLISGATKITDTWHWSSTEISLSTSWSLNFNIGIPGSNAKASSKYAVRPVSSISLNLPSFYKDYENVGELATAVGGLLSLDAFNKDFNIDTSVFDGVSYANVNYQLTFTSNKGAVWDGTYPYNITGGEKLLQFIVGTSYRCQILIPTSGLPATRCHFGKWFDWQTLPSFYKDYPDIASLARGIRPQTIKNGESERVYKIGVIQQGYNPFCYNFWVAGTNAAKPAECTLIVGDEGAGKGLADNVVMYKDWGAGEIGVSTFVEIAVVARTVYLVCKADASITFGEYAEEVTGVDLSSAYNVPFKKIPTFYKDYNSLSELKDALKAIW